jgi:hypothetical protein
MMEATWIVIPTDGEERTIGLTIHPHSSPLFPDRPAVTIHLSTDQAIDLAAALASAARVEDDEGHRGNMTYFNTVDDVEPLRDE